MSYQVYKIIHLSGILMIFLALGGAAVSAWSGGGKKYPGKGLVMATHGIGLLVALVGGFGLLARLGIISGLPLWVWLKIAIWVFLAGVVTVFVRKPSLAKGLWVICLLLGVCAAYLAQYKIML